MIFTTNKKGLVNLLAYIKLTHPSWSRARIRNAIGNGFQCSVLNAIVNRIHITNRKHTWLIWIVEFENGERVLCCIKKRKENKNNGQENCTKHNENEKQQSGESAVNEAAVSINRDEMKRLWDAYCNKSQRVHTHKHSLLANQMQQMQMPSDG